LDGSNSSQRESTNGQSYPIISLPDLEYSCAATAVRHHRWPISSSGIRVAELNRRGTSVRFPEIIRTQVLSHARQQKANRVVTDTSPTIVNRTLPQRLPNSCYRPREYLTEKEVDRLIEAARKRGRNGPRDAAAILLAYRHGLRAAELCSLRWSQIDLRNGRLHVNRARVCIRCTDQNCGPYGHYKVRALTSSQQKLARQLQQRGS